MGSGTWSTAAYRQRAKTRQASGKEAFEFSRSAMRSGNLQVHPSLNPNGLTYRESRDSDDHPESNAIIIGLDETGSMTRVIQGIHADLPQLLELLLGHNYIPHPQIMFSAFGDAAADQVPLQIGQFESDNRMDENLENMILEGRGGPYGMESYELMLFVAARHTSIDCWVKRKRKGYLFVIGDEMAYPKVKSPEVNKLIGTGLQEDIPLDEIIREVRERYHLYFIVPSGASGGENPNVYAFWTRRLGEQHVIRLENPEDIAETIALTIGLSEGTIGLNDGIAHLKQLGASDSTVDTVTKALTVVSPGSALVQGSGPRPTSVVTPDDDGGGEGSRRL
jgi:hypothetical protein